MNPTHGSEMLDALEADEQAGVVVLSGAGDSFSSGCQFLDREGGRADGPRQFLDEKAIRPGLESYERR
jgi:enoyl-CoA hydratase/carnithine racemase